MESSVGTLVAKAAQVASAWAGSTASAETTLQRQAEMMTEQALVDVGTVLADLQREVDRLRVRIAGSVAERSRSSLGAEGMAKRAGYARPALMLAQSWGITTAEAIRLCEVGVATMARQAISGEELPSRYPAIAEAIGCCTLGVDAAATIIRELDAASPRCTSEARMQGERLLVEQAAEFTVDELRKLAKLVRDRLDQDGAEPRDELRRARRSLRISTTTDGMIHVDWYLDPAGGGLVKASIDAIVGQQLRKPCPDGSREPVEGTAALPPDERTLEQLRSDAGVEIFRHVATCTDSVGDLPAFTMVVRMTMESLLTGLGRAEIEGIDETISAAAARRLAADAEIIPIVLGGRGEVLDVGTARRLFTRAQRVAFAERDGGCAWGNCNHPPSYTEAHHIEWWSRGGATDLDNGILLCSHHHHQVHEHGWEIVFREGVPFFIPPPHVDNSRRPRRGGRVDLARLRV